MKNVRFFLAAAAAAVLCASFTACADDDAIIEKSKFVGDGSIRYGVSSDSKAVTRGTATTVSNYLTQISNFSVWGYFAPGATGEGVTQGAQYIGSSATTGTVINGDGSGNWTHANGSDLRYWPATTAPLNFQAVTPATDASFSIENSVSSYLPHVTAVVTVPTTVTAQKDIMFAQQRNVTAATNNQTATLTFKHGLAQVVFHGKVATTDLTASVTELSIVNLHKAGRVGFFGTDCALTSTVTDEATTTFSLGLSSAAASITSTTAANITATDGALLILPQTVTKWQTTPSTPVTTTAANTAHNAYLKVKCTIKQGDWVIINDDYIYVPIDVAWEQGNKYVYTLVFGGDGAGAFDENGNINSRFSPVRYALTSVTEWNEVQETLPTDAYHLDIRNVAGGSAQIASYLAHADGTKEAVAWTASYSTNSGSSWDAAKPAWLTFTGSGAGSETYTTVTLHDGDAGGLGGATPVEDYDLSLHTTDGAVCAQTTANCYIIHAPGTYKLPLVYGNARKNGSDNPIAYNPAAEGGSVDGNERVLLRHDDSAITDPWLKNNGAMPDAAELLWQDVNGLIKNGSLEIDGDYLKFEVDADHIAEGNAVIAVKKGSNIVWSWHIWATSQTFSSASLTNVNAGSYTYKVTPVNLGWVGVTTTRSIMVKISQSADGGAEKTFTVTQTYANPSAGGTNTYYQWGRKDAFLPASNMTGTTDKTAYDISGSSITAITKTNSTVSTGTAIKAPTTFYYKNSSPYKWETAEKYNNWNINDNSGAENTQAATVKTVYDPCPPGFCVPTSGLYYYIKNKTRPSWSAGYTYSGIYFPASGCRYGGSGSLGGVGATGRCWSSTADDGTYGRDFYFYSGSWSLRSNGRASGYPVRAVAE